MFRFLQCLGIQRFDLLGLRRAGCAIGFISRPGTKIFQLMDFPQATFLLPGKFTGHAALLILQAGLSGYFSTPRLCSRGE